MKLNGTMSKPFWVLSHGYAEGNIRRVALSKYGECSHISITHFTKYIHDFVGVIGIEHLKTTEST